MMKYIGKLLMTALVGSGLGLMMSGCQTELSPEPFDANLRLTPGQVKLTVRPGSTTQQQIFRSLGAPNVVAMESGKGEIWTYDQIRVRRSAQGYNAGAYFATAFAFSKVHRYPNAVDLGKGVGDAGVDVSGHIGTATTSVLTATLVVRFDARGLVSSYNMLVTSF